MNSAHDDIQVGTARLAYSAQRGGWVTPGGNLITNPLKAQRIAETINNRMKREVA
ncbi:DUF1317 family protein [Cronobacter turicensis]